MVQTKVKIHMSSQEQQMLLPSPPIHSIDKGLPTHPIPKPRIGQDRAGLRRKVKTHQPISLPQQSPAQANNNGCSKNSIAIT